MLNFGSRSVISIDFHNVLDVHRVSNKHRVVAVEGEHGIPSQCRQAVQKPKDLGLAVIIASYVHTDWPKRRVVESCSTPPIDQIVICQRGDGTRFAGKLDCLRRSLIHIDDKAAICLEFRDAKPEHFGVCQIKHAGKELCPGVNVFRNLSVKPLSESLRRQ